MLLEHETAAQPQRRTETERDGQHSNLPFLGSPRSTPSVCDPMARSAQPNLS